MKTAGAQGGGLIAFVIIMAVVFSIGAMSVLYGAMAEVRLSHGQRWRAQARHLAEGEMVRRREKLFADSTAKGIESIIPAPVDGHTFEITSSVSTCTSGPGCADKIVVRVAY